jgi:hypothetical protein
MGRRKPGPKPRPLDVDKALEMARRGASQRAAAAALGVHQSTVSRRLGPEFAAARSRCEADGGPT